MILHFANRVDFSPSATFSLRSLVPVRPSNVVVMSINGTVSLQRPIAQTDPLDSHGLHAVARRARVAGCMLNSKSAPESKYSAMTKYMP